jgi:hypothetical protein
MVSNNQNLVIGWRNIAQATGRNPHTMAQAASFGTLPVTPLKVGNRVAMTPEQISTLKVPK